MAEKANLEKDLACERKKFSQLQSDISSLSRSITSSTSVSTQHSRQQQIDSKQKELAQCQKKIADIETKISVKLNNIYQNSQILEQAEKQEQNKRDQEQKKRDTDAKLRRDEELRHARTVTRETERQAQLQRQFRDSRLVIDLARLPETIKVLFVASNPIDQNQLRLDEEIRLITQKIRASEHRDSVEIVSSWAARPSDLLQALNEHKPYIVHFSGHGSSSNELVFQTDDGKTKLVSKEAIVTTMSTFTDNIRVVIFNACFSSDQAKAVTQHVDAAIGMNDSIGDTAARIFAAQFYSAIGFGCSIKQAFDQSKAALLMEGILEEDTPLLFTQDGVDPENIVLIRPPGLFTSDYLY
ncbi:MAG: CHAT domain-containing protein [Nostoc sp.]|uniref:CHAT domain-containing protein n=1 Tax=Nostoc sp. TaxID=1180 RepID=UPI002FF75E2A